MKIAVVGVGKMGVLIANLAEQQGHEIVARLDVGDDLALASAANVAIEFTAPSAAVGNLLKLAEMGVATVCGTTGWYERLPEIRSEFDRSGTALVYGSNFSIGVFVLRKLVAEAARWMREIDDYEAYAYEAHHSAKKDAPSGTLLTLVSDMELAGYQQAIDRGWNRAGSIPGTHEIGFDSVADTIQIRHVARSRMGFALGALHAARWTVGKKGVFEFSEIIQDIRL